MLFYVYYNLTKTVGEVKIMKQHLENYIDTIKKFPIKKKYTKDELLIPKLLVEKREILKFTMPLIMNILIQKLKYLLLESLLGLNK